MHLLRTSSINSLPSNSTKASSYATSTTNAASNKRKNHGRILERQSSSFQSLSKKSERQSWLKGNNPASLEKFRHGISLSPRTFVALQACRRVWESPRSKTAVSLAALLGIPSVAYGSLFPADSFGNHIIAIWTAWDGLLSIGSLVVMAFTIPAAFAFVEWASVIPSPSNKAIASKSEVWLDIEDALEACSCGIGPTSTETLSTIEANNVKHIVTKAKSYIFSTRNRLFNSIASSLLVFFLILLGLVGPNSLVSRQLLAWDAKGSSQRELATNKFSSFLL